MRIAKYVVVSAVLAWQALSVHAASFPGTISRDSLTTAESLNRLSIGVNYEQIKRDVEFDRGFSGSLEAQTVDGSIAVDVTPWLSPFVTVGGTSASAPDEEGNGDYRTKWSVGLSFNAWDYQLEDPSWMAGVLSIRAVAEFASYSSDNVGLRGDEYSWTDLTVSIPFSYELFEDLSPLYDKSLQKSLSLHVGPIFSILDGDVKNGGFSESFNESSSVGFMGGADIFLARNLSIGGGVTYFDDVSFNANLRYHF